MEYRNLGKSGIRVSEIGLGSSDFGWRIDERESASIIDHALDLGINFIDTGDTYNDGLSEEFVGKALESKRSKVIISTKFSWPVGEGPNDRGGSRYYIMKAIDASLKRLNTDYIDLYYIHWPDVRTPIEETLRTLDGLVRSGKVRYLGCSNFAAWQLCESLWTSKANNLESFVVFQSRYNLVDRRIEAEVVPCCQEYGIGVIPWNPLAAGFLTGKYHRGEPAPDGTRLALKRPPIPPGILANLPVQLPTAPPVLTDANFDKLEKLQEFSAEHGHTVGELAISWLLSHSWLTSVITGATKNEQVSKNVASANWRLTPLEVDRVNQII